MQRIAYRVYTSNPFVIVIRGVTREDMRRFICIALRNIVVARRWRYDYSLWIIDEQLSTLIMWNNNGDCKLQLTICKHDVIMTIEADTCITYSFKAWCQMVLKYPWILELYWNFVYSGKFLETLWFQSLSGIYHSFILKNKSEWKKEKNNKKKNCV